MFLTPLVFIAAIVLEILGSYMSVIGLSSKSSVLLIILAIALDFSKIVIASVLYKNWKELNLSFKLFLVPTLLFLVVVTSYGAYAYLLQEFGKTTATGEQMSAKYAALEEESKKINARKKEIDAQIAAVDPAYVSQKRRLNTMFSKELEYLNQRSIELDRAMPELKSNMMSDNLQAGTLGSLAKAWGTTPDQTAKIIALMMVVVIDPLAIVMLMVGNFLQIKRAEEKAREKKQSVRVEKVAEVRNQEFEPVEKAHQFEALPEINEQFEPLPEINEQNDKEEIPQNFHETIQHNVVENNELLKEEKKLKTLKDYIVKKSGTA